LLSFELSVLFSLQLQHYKQQACSKALVNVPAGLGRFQRPTILALCSLNMKLLLKLLVSVLILYPYTFFVIWFSTIPEPSIREGMQGTARILFFITAFSDLIFLWIYTWINSYRDYTVIGLLASLLFGVIYAFWGYPHSLGMLAASTPLILLSAFYVIQQYRQRATT